MQLQQLPVNEETYVAVYLRLMNVFMKLTEKELEVLELFIRLGALVEPIDTGMRQQAQLVLKLKTPSNLNNYISSMKAKKVLVSDVGHNYRLNPIIHPSVEGVSFQFLWNQTPPR
jgi:hypothetical protein